MAKTEQGRTPGALAPLDLALLARASSGLDLCAEPYAALGAELGLGGDAVIERLRRLMAHGVIGGLGPCWAAENAVEAMADTLSSAAANASANTAESAATALAQLRAATCCGLPLVARPYEALGAMLGWTAQRVCDEFAAALRAGQLLRLAPWPPGACSPH